MLNKKVAIPFLFIILSLVVSNVNAATGTPNMTYKELVARYIIQISNHVSWPNQSKIKQYNIHIIDNDQAISDYLSPLSSAPAFKNKPFKISYSKGFLIPSNTHVVYINSRNFNVKQNVLEELNGRSVLLISNGSADKNNVMINLFDNETDKIQFEINKANIINHNLGIEPDIILLGGTEIDVAQLYKDNQLTLREIQRLLDENQKSLISTNRQISTLHSEKRTLVSEVSSLKNISSNYAQAVITAKNELEEQTREFESQRKSLATTINKLNEQQEKVIQGQIFLENQKRQINDQLDIIAQKNKLINIQNTKVNNIEKTIETKQITIEKQELVEFYLKIFTAILILLSLLLFISYKHQKRTSNKLTDATKTLEAASKAKSDFLSQMSHELRTPLNAILGFSGILSRESSIETSSMRHVELINRSGMHLLALVNNILDMSKIEANMLELDLDDFDFKLVIDDIVLMLKDIAEKKGLALNVEIASTVPRYINTDQVKLKQVLINLIANSIKFTTSGSILLKINSQKQNDKLNLHFQLEDTGVGIPEDKIHSIFKPFVQVSNNLSQVGTGLGLTITGKFVELMGGQIKVESQVGQGTTFKFNILVESVSESLTINNAPHIIRLKPGQKSYRLLIVDDNKENSALLEHILNSIGFTTRTAVNGEDAIDAFEQWQPHLIWMDLHMPIMDGLTATTIIREMAGGEEVKIVILTANVFKEKRNEIQSSGCNDILFKPYINSDIYKCLTTHLHVEYLTEEPDSEYDKESLTLTPKLCSETLNELPEELKQSLISAAIELNTEKLILLTEQVEMSSLVQAKAIRKAVEDYDLMSILSALNANNI